MVQFDYLHRMYSYLLLFPLFLLGVSLGIKEEKKVTNLSLTTIFLCIYLSFFLLIYSGSWMLLQAKQYELSRLVYPLQKEAYRSEIGGKTASLEVKKNLSHRYSVLFSGEYLGFYELGKIYEKEGNVQKAIINYEESFWLDPFRDVSMAERIYNLKRKYPGNGSPKWFADKLFVKLNNDTGRKVLSYNQWVFINTFCQRVYKLHCIYFF